MRVRILKDWDYPDLVRQTPSGCGEWDGIRFTTEAVPECDALLVLNNRMPRDTRVTCPTGNVIALMQEPYQKGLTDWLVEGHEAFARVLTHHPPSAHPRYERSHPAIPWHVNRTFDQLEALAVPKKTRPLSWVVGNAADLPGHLRRRALLRSLQGASGLDVDLFGRAVRPIEDKAEGLLPYRYSLAVENTFGTDYWTEKIADCFLCWCVPLYYGCPNLERYFPEDAFIRIDIENPEAAADRIRRIVGEDDWKRRLPALEEARRRVLQRWQLFPHLARWIRARGLSAGRPETVTVPAYRRSLRASVYRLGYKVNRALGFAL
jgi:hypothetical protein